MHIRRFHEKDFATYKSWFADPELSANLGPLDQEWLEYVLNDVTGDQFVAFEKGEMVAVCGVIYPSSSAPHFFIADVSVYPPAKRFGVATRLLNELQTRLDSEKTYSWKASIDRNNLPAIRLVERLGWHRDPEKDTDDMIGWSTA